MRRNYLERNYLEEAERFAQHTRMQSDAIAYKLEKDLSEGIKQARNDAEEREKRIAAMQAEKERLLSEMENIYMAAISDCESRLAELEKRKEANARRRADLEAQGVKF